MNKNTKTSINIDCNNIRKQLLRTEIKNVYEGGDYMYNYLTQSNLQNELFSKFNSDNREFEKFIENIKMIENYNFKIEEIAIQDEIGDSEVKVNICDAFSEDEINEYNALKLKFKEKMREFAFINNIYRSQKKCANDNFDLALAIKIKILIDDVDDKIECEKKAIYGINKIINDKEKMFASKVKDFKSVLDTMKCENNIDERKLSLLFGENFVANYKGNLMSNLVIDFLKKNKNYSFDKLVENSNYFKNIAYKYPSLKEKVEYGLGTNS